MRTRWVVGAHAVSRLHMMKPAPSSNRVRADLLTVPRFRLLLQKAAQHPRRFFVDLDPLGQQIGRRFVADFVRRGE